MELIERLRHMAKLLGVGNFDIPALLNESAAEIERLNAEVAKLRLVIVHEADCTEAADDEVMRRGHEIERLREALRNIAIGGIGETMFTVDEMRACAGHALSD